MLPVFLQGGNTVSSRANPEMGSEITLGNTASLGDQHRLLIVLSGCGAVSSRK
jgi:hypothetical protein